MIQTNKILNITNYDLVRTQKGFDTIINYIKNVVCLSKIRNNETGIYSIDYDEQNKKYLFLMSWIKRIFNLEKIILVSYFLENKEQVKQVYFICYLK